jgi:hypothetical protein
MGQMPMLQKVGNGWGANLVGIAVIIVMPMHAILRLKIRTLCQSNGVKSVRSSTLTRDMT